MTTQILESLERLGLNSTCGKVLLHLLEKGPQKAGVISKMLNIKRPTVYSALNELLQSGTVSREGRGTAGIYVPAPPSKISGLLTRAAQKRMNELKEVSEGLSGLLANLPNHALAATTGLQVEIVDTLNNYDRTVLDVLLHQEFLAIWNPSKAFFRSSWRKDTLAYLEYTGSRQTIIREILTAGKETDWYCSKIRNPNHSVKVVQGDTGVMVDMVIGQDSILISCNDPQFPGAIKVKSPILRPFFAEIFERVWKSS